MIVQDIYQFINQIAPFATAEGFDNAGLIIGAMDSGVTGIMVALDATASVLEEAKEHHCNLLVTHHPVIFDPLHSIAPQTVVYKAIANGQSVLCAHTNYDKAIKGVNYTLATQLGIANMYPIEEESTPHTGMGRIGTLVAPMGLEGFASIVKSKLTIPSLRCYNSGRPIAKVAVCGGAGGALLEKAAAMGADILVTGDVKLSAFIRAQELGISLMDAGHYATEAIAMPVLTGDLAAAFPQLNVRLAISSKSPIQEF